MELQTSFTKMMGRTKKQMAGVWLQSRGNTKDQNENVGVFRVV